MYLDPGAGSVILQVILAAILGIGVFTRLYWQKARSLLRLSKKENEAPRKSSVE